MIASFAEQSSPVRAEMALEIAALHPPMTSSRGSLSGHALLAAFFIQGTLGISTLLLSVPVGLGAAHQGGAVLFFAAALWHAHASARQKTQGREKWGLTPFSVRQG